MIIINSNQFCLITILYIINVVTVLMLILTTVRYKGFVRSTIYVDELTHIYNRRYGNRYLDKIYNGEVKNSFPLSIILFDIDDFKNYNDTYGHPEGDTALKFIADEINKISSSTRVAYRYGGEEFVLILRGVNNESAKEIANSILKTVDESSSSSALLKRRITLSAGIYTANSDNRDSKVLIANADRALYEAKTAGKNRICSLNKYICS